MNKYIVWYDTTDDDYCSVWCYANSEDEARRIVEREYWDCKRVRTIEKMR